MENPELTGENVYLVEYVLDIAGRRYVRISYYPFLNLPGKILMHKYERYGRTA